MAKQTVYVVIWGFGEYDNRDKMILGVFTTTEKSQAAAERWAAANDLRLAEWCEEAYPEAIACRVWRYAEVPGQPDGFFVYPFVLDQEVARD